MFYISDYANELKSKLKFHHFYDIKGVCSKLCEHIIFIEGFKPSRESQRVINLHLLEVLKNKVLK